MSRPDKLGLFMKILTYGLVIPVLVVILFAIPVVVDIILMLGVAFLMDVNKDSKRGEENKHPD